MANPSGAGSPGRRRPLTAAGLGPRATDRRPPPGGRAPAAAAGSDAPARRPAASGWVAGRHRRHRRRGVGAALRPAPRPPAKPGPAPRAGGAGSRRGARPRGTRPVSVDDRRGARSGRARRRRCRVRRSPRAGVVGGASDAGTRAGGAGDVAATGRRAAGAEVSCAGPRGSGTAGGPRPPGRGLRRRRRAGPRPARAGPRRGSTGSGRAAGTPAPTRTGPERAHEVVGPASGDHDVVQLVARGGAEHGRDGGAPPRHRVRHHSFGVAGTRLPLAQLREHPPAVALHDAGVGRSGQAEQGVQCVRERHHHIVTPRPRCAVSGDPRRAWRTRIGERRTCGHGASRSVTAGKSPDGGRRWAATWCHSPCSTSPPSAPARPRRPRWPPARSWSGSPRSSASGATGSPSTTGCPASRARRPRC